MKHIFDQFNHAQDRARCPTDAPPECRGGKRTFDIQVGAEHAYCHRCGHTWQFGEKEQKGNGSMPVLNRTKNYVKSSGAVTESQFGMHRKNFQDHFDMILDILPWNDDALKEEYGLGVRNDKDIPQLVFKINDNHIKWHKGKQFGDAECKIYPESVLDSTDPESTLLITEGEKDAVTVNCHGLPAITFTSGAGAVPADLKALKPFKSLVIAYDGDKAGRDGALKVARELHDRTMHIRILELENGIDLTDHFAAGNTADDLLTLIDNAYVFGNDPVDLGGDPVFKVFDFVKKFDAPTEWYCDELLLKNGRTSVAGKTNVGKSLFAMQFGICLAMGAPFLTFNIPKARRVLLVQFEMLDNVITNRLIPMTNSMLDKYPDNRDALANNLEIISADKKTLFENAYTRIAGNLRAAKEPFEVLIIDNLYTSTDLDTVRNDQLQILIGQLEEVRTEFGVAMLVVQHHTKHKGEQTEPLDIEMVFGGMFFAQWIDNMIQLAKTFHTPLKVMKMTKTRDNSDFHHVPVGIKLNSDKEKKRLHFEFMQPLPKNESYWYRDKDRSDEDRVLEALDTAGDNFTYDDMRKSLEEILNITSSASVSSWLKKLIKHQRIIKIERGIYAKVRTELEKLL